jgi:hypothetical protein
MVRFKMRIAPGMVEGLNVRDATEGAEYLLSFPMPGSGWTVVQRYLRNAVYKRFGKPDVPKDGLVGDEVSSIQIAYLGTELCLDDFEIFGATTDLPELPSDYLLPKGSYQPRKYAGLESTFPFGVITTVAAGDAANAAFFGQTQDERFEDDLLDLKRHGMNALSNFCDDSRVAWRLSLMDKYCLYLVETALANTDLRALPADHPSLRLIEQNRNHPRLLAWYGRDEPQDCLAYLDNKRALNARDPNHPVASAFNQMQVAKLLGPYMELMMLDPYSVFRPERSADALAFHADLIRNVRRYCQGRKVWLIPQAFSWRSGKATSMRMPDPAEARFDVFNAIGAGASGFLFFIYNDTCTYLDGQLRGEEFDDTLVDPWGNAHPTYEALAALARPLVSVMPALLDAAEPVEGKVAVQYPRDKLVLGGLRNAAGDYLIFTSKDLAHPCRGEARVLLPPGRRLYDLLALREVPVRADGAFDLALSPGGGAILLLASPDRWRTVKSGILARRLRQDRELLSVECALLKKRGLDVRRAEEVLQRLARGEGTPQALRGVREELAAQERGNPAYWTMRIQLDRAQRSFGEIHRLIRPVVAIVDGTQDKPWLQNLAQLKALSVTYFAIRRKFNAGDFSEAKHLSGLLNDLQALQAQIEERRERSEK